MVYSNILGQIRVGVRSGSITPPVPPTIFDQVSYTTIAGYSLRKLKNTYTGSAVRVRRTYDNSEMNIGFDSTGILDTNTIKSFVNAGKTLAEQDLSNWSNLPSYSGNLSETIFLPSMFGISIPNFLYSLNFSIKFGW